MSELPNGWLPVTLQDIAVWSSGGTPSRANPSYYSGQIPWLKTGELGPKVIYSAEEHISITAVDASSAKIFPKGSVAIAMYGATIGKTSILGIDAATNQACAVGIPDGTSTEFLYYFLRSQEKSFVDAGKGGAQPNISQGIVKGWPMHLPPRAEQTRIVAKLEELLSDLDAGVAELKAAQKKLGQYRQSLLKAAVEGALTAEWRAHNRPTETGAQLLQRILIERRTRWEAKQLAKFAEQGKTPPKDWQKKYPEPVKPDTTNLPELPEGWVWVTTGLIAESIVPNRDKPLTFTGHIPWITTPDFEQADLHLQKSISGLGLSEEECEMYRARVVPPQGVIMTCVGRFGLSAVLDVRSVINQQLHAFIPETYIRAEYLAFVIQAQRNWFERNATSTTIAYLNKEKCESLPVPLPPVNEQDAILNFLKSQLDSIAEQLRNVSISLKQSTAQRQNILRAAFAGQLVLQDPNDEPASVLLERIRAERALQAASKKPRGRKAKEGA